LTIPWFASVSTKYLSGIVSTSTKDGWVAEVVIKLTSWTCVSPKDVGPLLSSCRPHCFNPFVTRPTISEKTSPSLLASLDQNLDKSFFSLVVCTVGSSVVIVEYPLVQDVWALVTEHRATNPNTTAHSIGLMIVLVLKVFNHWVISHFLDFKACVLYPIFQICQELFTKSCYDYWVSLVV